MRATHPLLGLCVQVYHNTMCWLYISMRAAPRVNDGHTSIVIGVDIRFDQTSRLERFSGLRTKPDTGQDTVSGHHSRCGWSNRYRPPYQGTSHLSYGSIFLQNGQVNRVHTNRYHRFPPLVFCGCLSTIQSDVLSSRLT